MTFFFLSLSLFKSDAEFQSATEAAAAAAATAALGESKCETIDVLMLKAFG